MAFRCTDTDFRNLDAFLRGVLDAHKNEQITTDRAVIIVRHVIVAAAADASTDFRTRIMLSLEQPATKVYQG